MKALDKLHVLRLQNSYLENVSCNDEYIDPVLALHALLNSPRLTVICSLIVPSIEQVISLNQTAMVFCQSNDRISA
jgi:hypothetical protein